MSNPPVPHRNPLCPAVQDHKELEPLPAIYGWEAGYTLDRSAGHRRAKGPIKLFKIDISVAAFVHHQAPSDG